MNARRTRDGDEAVRALDAELAACGPSSGRARLETITDRYVVRHPGIAGRLRDALDAALNRRSDAAAASRSSTASGRVLDVPDVSLPQDAPQHLGGYRLLRVLGRGGMGVVYLAHDTELRRLVAVKSLAPELAAHPDFRRRFEREELVAARLTHPGIVPVYDVGEAEGVPYFVMRWIDGEDLGRWMSGRHRQGHDDDPESAETTDITAGRPPREDSGHEAPTAITPERSVGEVLRVIELSARALHHAHEQGVTHRDVKPSNILVDAEGQPHIADFGLARITGDVTLTDAGSLLGTIPYMSPEQVAQRRGPIDRRTDVYSLGVALFECLTGARPFVGSAPEGIIYQILMREPPRPRRLNPELPIDVETVVLHCLEKDPADRYQSCLELAEEIARIRAHQSIDAERVGPIARSWRWVRRHPALSLCIAVAAIALVVAATMPIRRRALIREQKQHESARQLEFAHGLVESSRELVAARGSTPIEERSDLETDIAAARETALLHFGRSLGEWHTPEAARARADFIYAWYEDACERGDERAAALGAMLAGSRHAANVARMGRLTLLTDPPGARVTAMRYAPDGVGRLVHDDDAGIDLGLTPIDAVALPAGSYRIRIELNGRLPAWYPVLIEHGEHWGDPGWHGGKFAARNWTVSLVEPDRREEMLDPSGWRHVPCGPYLGRGEALGDVDGLTWHWVDGFLMQTHEETFGRYNAFIRDKTEDRRLARSESESLAFIPRCHVGGRDRARLQIDRITGRVIDLDESQPPLEEFVELPACGLRWAWATAFADWFGAELPTLLQWEKAARGVDGRRYPWGDVFDWSFTVGRRSLEDPLGPGGIPAPGGTAPADVSPYGLVDLAGNVSEWCRSIAPDGARFLAGGSRSSGRPADLSLDVRHRIDADTYFGDFTGFRMVLPLRR